MSRGITYIGVSAGAMIFNEKGELFLAKRGKNTTNQQGCWETPGGSVNFGEKLSDAVKREVKEEYGVEIDLIEQFPAADELLKKEKQHWVATTFLAKIKNGQTPKIMEPHKCDAIGWFSLDNLPRPLSYITTLDLKLYNERYKVEMVDIVNEDNEILYKTSKQKAHSLGLLHRTVIGEVKNEKGEWLLVKQASDRQDAGQYVSPIGGHVRTGETEEEALQREAFEEVGLKKFKTKFIGKKIFNRKILGRQENHYFILYEVTSSEKPVLNHESVAIKTFTKKTLKEQMKKNPIKFGDAFYFIVKTFYPGLIS
jgi:8-oxo-dGTP diphosphatase